MKVSECSASITVRNGTIAGFRIGITAASNFLIVEDMRIVANIHDGIFAPDSFGSVFRNNIIADNGNLEGGFSGLRCGQSCLVEGNYFQKCRAWSEHW